MTPVPRPRPSLIVPVLAAIVTALSFWIAAASHSWPMALAGLAAWFLALSYIRIPRRSRPEAEVTVTVIDPPRFTSEEISAAADKIVEDLAAGRWPDRPIRRVTQ